MCPLGDGVYCGAEVGDPGVNAHVRTFNSVAKPVRTTSTQTKMNGGFLVTSTLRRSRRCHHGVGGSSSLIILYRYGWICLTFGIESACTIFLYIYLCNETFKGTYTTSQITLCLSRHRRTDRDITCKKEDD